MKFFYYFQIVNITGLLRDNTKEVENMISKHRPVYHIPYFSSMTDSEFAEELYIRRPTEEEKADSLPIDDEDAFGTINSYENWTDQ